MYSASGYGGKGIFTLCFNRIFENFEISHINIGMFIVEKWKENLTTDFFNGHLGSGDPVTTTYGSVCDSGPLVAAREKKLVASFTFAKK